MPCLLFAQTSVITVTVSGGGAVMMTRQSDGESLDPDGETVNNGTAVILKAYPYDGESFTNWTGDLLSSQVIDTVTVNATTNITANFSGTKQTFPGATWTTETAANSGMSQAWIDSVKNATTEGVIVRYGKQVDSWGSYTTQQKQASAGKFIMCLMFQFAVQEGLAPGWETKIKEYAVYSFIDKDTTMTAFHLANNLSGYSRGETPGAAFAYNDTAFALFADLVYDSLYANANGNPSSDVVDPDRLGDLQFQELGTGIYNMTPTTYRTMLSERDFARLGWFLAMKGAWNNRQLIEKEFFDNYWQSHVKSFIPRTTTGGTDYLNVDDGFGGSNDQTSQVAGRYGMTLWWNNDKVSWSSTSKFAYKADGNWGIRNIAIFPKYKLVCAWQWDTAPANAETFISDSDDVMRFLENSVTDMTEESGDAVVIIQNSSN